MSNPLKPDVIEHFVEVVVRCLRATVGVDAVVGSIAAPALSPTIAVTLDFCGDVRGPVTWVFPEAMALELVRRLLCDPDPDPQSAPDGATELANILTGHATEALEAYGFQCAIGVPRIHTGELPGGTTVHMRTPDGPIAIVMSMAISTLRSIPVLPALA